MLSWGKNSNIGITLITEASRKSKIKYIQSVVAAKWIVKKQNQNYYYLNLLVSHYFTWNKNRIVW